MFTADNTDLEVPKKARRAEVTAAFALGTFVVAGGLDLVLPSSVPLATLLFLLPVGLVTAALGASAGLLVGALSAGFALASAAGLPLPLLAGLMASRAVGAGLCAAAVSKVAADRARYRAQAERDPLTGVLNRRGFFARANEELERARRHQRPISLVFLDLDDFKQVNDRHGHLRGDAVLASLGGLLAHGRAGDLAARLGGDEFVLLMPETDRAAAEAALARLRSRATEALAQPGFTATFSSGLCSFTAAPASVADLLRAADAELLAHKRLRHGGRKPRLTAVPQPPRVEAQPLQKTRSMRLAGSRG